LKILADILQNILCTKIVGDTDVPILNLSIDSRTCGNNTCFIALAGATTDGHNYIDAVIAAGTKCIVCQKMSAATVAGVTYIIVENTAQVAGLMAANFYNQPSAFMQVVGITGTNGKTTCATLLFQLFTKLGYQCGLISTVHNLIGTKILPSTHTTPDAINVQALLKQMQDAGCAYVFMEVSSHAVVQHRIAGIQFAGGMFTNITHDHLDYHGTFDNYIAAKKLFFDGLPQSAFAISNLDDKRGTIMLQNTKASKKYYALKNIADYKGKILENNLDGLMLDINNVTASYKMIGEFNAYNLLAVYAVAINLGKTPEDILAPLSALAGAEGRFDYIKSIKQNILGIIDYAHTPDALINVLATINKLKTGNEKVLTLVGCGGDRDKTKRPIMAQVACEHSDKVILTSDNPRTENASDILNDMKAGVPVYHVKKYVSIEDRREAIKTICQMANPNDIILIAGKGHEKYQDIQGVKYEFDDKKILQETFELLEL
jgi:UDP-N-acetylmuramoyl-L-alanyl-D-glutamate--2,6-diaminopimelate ligase